jgi:hypothetical protein
MGVEQEIGDVGALGHLWVWNKKLVMWGHWDIYGCGTRN